jgi:hypothetical protein
MLQMLLWDRDYANRRRSDDCVSLLRAPTAAMVAANLVLFLKNGIDRCPGGFSRILAGEERSVAGHRVAQQQLVAPFLVRLLLEQIKLSADALTRP